MACVKLNQNEELRQSAKSKSYYCRYRKDIIEMIPPDTKRVLSVGCASGITEQELVKRGIKVDGVELNHEAAEAAKKRGLNVFEGDVSEIEIDTDNGQYDLIIYADILEHLPDPVNILQRHLRYLKSGGYIFVSVPNFRYYSIFWKLFIRGQIKYSNAGILDRTHLRITTRKMVLDWFDEVGLIPVSWKYQILGRRNKLLSACLLGTAKEFLANIIICIGRKP